MDSNSEPVIDKHKLDRYLDSLAGDDGKEDGSRFQEAKKIIEEVRKAFAGVVLGGGVGLKESMGLDDRCDADSLARLRESDEKIDWQRIPSSELAGCSSGLSYFDAEGMRFHLPAFLVSDLLGQYGFGLSYVLTDMSPESTSIFSLLDDPQRLAVRNYLLYLLDDPGDIFENSDIEEALSHFWK